MTEKTTEDINEGLQSSSNGKSVPKPTFSGRVFKIVKWSVSIFFLVCIILILLLQSHAFQTWAGKKASAWLSNELKTKIEIESIAIDFFSQAQLKGIFIQDLKKDTLLYGESISVKISDFSLSKKFLKINVTRLDHITAKVIQYENEKTFNFQFLADYFSSSDTVTADTSTFRLGYGNLVLNDINLYFCNKNDTATIKGMKFTDLAIRNLSCEFNNIDIGKENIQLNISKMKFKEKCGLTLRRLDAQVKISPKEISLNGLLLETEKSKIVGSYKMTQRSYDDFSDFLNKININAELKENTLISARDLAFFVPEVSEMQNEIRLSGVIKGTVNQLNGEKINLSTAEFTKFTGNFSVNNLTQPDSLFLQLDIRNLATHPKDLIGINIPGMQKQDQISAFSPLSPLGKISYNGKIKGYLYDLAARGVLTTEAGVVELDAGVSNIGKKHPLQYHGNISMNQLKLGILSHQEDIGQLTGKIQIEGQGTDLNTLDVKFDGIVNSFGYKNYDYRNLSMRGVIKNRKFEGGFELKDPHADVVFDGSAGINPKNLDLDFIATINKIELNKINLASEKDSIHNLSSHIAIKISGSDINNITGRIGFNNLLYELNKDSYHLKDFDLILKQDEDLKNIHLSSGVADVDVHGKFNITDLPNSFRQYLEKYFPTLIKEKKIPAGKIFKDNFKFNIAVKNFNLIRGLVLPELSIAKGTLIEGNYDAQRSELSINGKSNKIQFKNFVLSDWDLDVRSLSKSIEIQTGVQRAWMSDSFYVAGFRFSSSSYDNQSGFNIIWNNDGAKKYSGDILGRVNFSNSEIELSMNKIDLWVADSLWSLKDSTNYIRIDTTGKIVVQGINMSDHEQLIKVEGGISKLPDDALSLELKNFQLSQINPLIQNSLTKLKGTISGKAKVSGINGKMIFSSDFDFEDLFLNDKMIGKGKIKSIYDADKELVSVDGYFTKGNVINGKLFNNIEFNGYYLPSKKEDNIDLVAKMNALDITLLQPYLTDIITFAPLRGGAIEGTCSVKGSVLKPLITGRLSLMNVKNLKVDYLNTFYNATGVINIFPDRILLGDENPPNGSVPDPIHLFDKDGHEATVWGNIFHDNFKISKLDFDINAHNFMVLNTNGKNNPSYFGKAFVTGTVGIYGNTDYMNMEINLKTEKNTEFNIPLTGPATVEENDYIIFVNKDTTKKTKNDYNKSLSGINLDLNLEATPNATVKMIFDSKSGDVISAKGNGNIKMVINTNGKFEMYGLYTLTNGDYMFSLENVISKKFEIISGSTIKWAGDPLNADINITAGYNQNSSLTPFFPSDSTGMYSKPVKAGVLLNMKDKLLTPDISFGISLPTVDETTRQTVLSYINNEQEMNRQVFSLLLLKSFVTPLQLANQGVELGAGSAASRTSSEMLSNQLSNWLAQLSTGMDISVNITPEQMDVALSKQLFNDRLSIDGNVGVNNASGQKTSNMIGDIQVDYKVYPDGKLRLKGFNKSNDNTQISTLGGPFTQGMGIYYREEFNTVDELYDRYLGWMRRKKKKEN